MGFLKMVKMLSLPMNFCESLENPYVEIVVTASGQVSIKIRDDGNGDQLTLLDKTALQELNEEAVSNFAKFIASCMKRSKREVVKTFQSLEAGRRYVIPQRGEILVTPPHE